MWMGSLASALIVPIQQIRLPCDEALNIMMQQKRILGECLLISSLPGKALRTLVDIASDSICFLKAKPGKLDIKRCEPGILFISLPIVSLFKCAIMA